MRGNIVATIFLSLGLIATSFVNAAVDTREDINGNSGGVIRRH